MINYLRHSGYKVEFEASVKMVSAIKDIRSPTHKITSTNYVQYLYFLQTMHAIFKIYLLVICTTLIT